MDVTGREAFGAARHQEAENAILAARPDHGHAGDAAIGDPQLVAVEDPIGPGLAGAGAHAAGIAAGIGLGEAEAPDHLAARHLGQPLLLLLLGAVSPDREHGQRALHGDEGAEAGVAGLQLQAGQPVAGGAGARTAIALQVHAEQAQVADLARHLLREDALFEPLLEAGQHPAAHEPAHAVPDQALLVRELAIEAQQVIGVGLGPRRVRLRGGHAPRTYSDARGCGSP